MMPILRKILTIAWTDVQVEFSYRSTIVFFLILPLVFTTIIGLGLGAMYSGEAETGDQRYRVLVVDQDGSSLSAMLVDTLNASEVARAVVIEADPADAEGMAQRLEDEDAPAWLLIPEGFERNLLAASVVTLPVHPAANDTRTLAVDQALKAAVGQVSSAVQAANASVREAEKARPFADAAERQAYFNASLAQAQEQLRKPPARAKTTQAETVEVEIASGFEQASPGQLVTWVMITLLGASEVFVNERLGGTLRRLLVTPTQKATILLGKITGRLGMGLVQMALLIGFGALALGVHWGRSMGALALVLGAFALAAVALGVLLGALARTRGQASGLTTMFAMLLSALGGAWWPLEVTPPVYQAVVKAFPTTWAMMAFNDVILRGQGVVEVLPKVGVLLLFAAVFFVIGLKRLKFQ